MSENVTQRSCPCLRKILYDDMSCVKRMPVLPKQADETDFEPAGVWSTPTSSVWTGRRPDDSGAQLTGDDVAYCCLPSGCPNYVSDPICLSDLGDAVKVSCSYTPASS